LFVHALREYAHGSLWAGDVLNACRANEHVALDEMVTATEVLTMLLTSVAGSS
jgi:hypothetical protein